MNTHLRAQFSLIGLQCLEVSYGNLAEVKVLPKPFYPTGKHRFLFLCGAAVCSVTLQSAKHNIKGSSAESRSSEWATESKT